MGTLKISREEKNEQATMLGTEDNPRADYGYGTRLCLREEQVDSVGAGKIKPGTKVKIVAYGYIASSTQFMDADEGKEPEVEMSVDIQLTDMEVSGASSVDAAAMYPSSNI